VQHEGHHRTDVNTGPASCVAMGFQPELPCPLYFGISNFGDYPALSVAWGFQASSSHIAMRLVVHFDSALRVSDVITESNERYGFRSVLRMACYGAPTWGVNKNKEKNRQERE
jgi:hypothetical protein